ncbi:hypothetical protein I4U23_015675 [Adineta vaga]|nr:hypothetical protein I4U23_015675 [Adineta vaga]
MSLLYNYQFEYSNTTKSNAHACQTVCLRQNQCKAASFHRSTLQCQLFTDLLKENSVLLNNNNIDNMFVRSQSRFSSGMYAFITNEHI